jgi:hypothetical protein
MNLRTTYILFGVLLAGLAGLALTRMFGLGQRSSKSDFVFPELHAKNATVQDKDIDTVRIEHPDSSTGTIEFVRDAKKNWVMQAPRKVRVDQFTVNHLVNQVLGATKEKVEVVNDLKEYELDKPHYIVTLSKGEESWTLKVGKQSQGTQPNVYVASSSRPKEPVAVKKSSLDNVFKTLNQFRSKSLVSASASEAQSVEMQAAGKKESLALEKGKDARWTFKKPGDYGEADYEGEGPPPLSTETRKITGVLGLLQAVTGLQVEHETDFVADDVGDQELKDKYGLDATNPATLRVELTAVKSTPGEEEKTTVNETLLIGKKVAEPKDDKKPEKKDEKEKDKKAETAKEEFYYARLASENNVVKVPAKKVETLTQLAAEPDVLRSRDLAHFERDKVDAIVIENAEGTIRLFKTDNPEPWKLWRDKKATKAEESVVRSLLDLFDYKKDGKHRVDSFPSVKPEQAGMDKNARLAVVSLWTGGLKKQENKDAEPQLTQPDKPTVRLTIGKQLKDRGLVYVLREAADEKQPALLLVKDKEGAKEGLVDRVTPGPLAYLDRKLPAIPMGADTQAKQVTLTRGGETFQLKSEKSGEVEHWKFEAPKELAGRSSDAYAVRDILFGLQRLQPLRVAAENPNDKQLEGFGLKPPQTEVTVVTTNKDNKEDKHTYSFGKETPDKTGIFARASGSDLVYVVPSSVLTPLQAELQDKAIFTFDVEKVRGLKISGWKNVTGITQTLDLERKSKNSWVAKSPQGYEVEPTVAESFLHTLSSLKAIKFLRGGLKPEYGLDTAKNPGILTIEIMVEGEKAPLSLTIGLPDAADKGYYAATGTAKDQPLVMPEEPFKPVLEKPVYFTRAGQ